MVLELGKYFAFMSVDVSIASPVCFGIVFTFYDRFMWSTAMAWGLIVLPTVGAVFAPTNKTRKMQVADRFLGAIT